MKRHIRDIHLQRLQCEVCDKTFGRSRRGRLLKHMTEKHGYPVHSSFNVNIPLCDPSSSSVCPVNPVEVSVPSKARFLPPTPATLLLPFHSISPPLICSHQIKDPAHSRPLGLGLWSQMCWGLQHLNFMGQLLNQLADLLSATLILLDLPLLQILPHL